MSQQSVRPFVRPTRSANSIETEERATREARATHSQAPPSETEPHRPESPDPSRVSQRGAGRARGVKGREIYSCSRVTILNHKTLRCIWWGLNGVRKLMSRTVLLVNMWIRERAKVRILIMRMDGRNDSLPFANKHLKQLCHTKHWLIVRHALKVLCDAYTRCLRWENPSRAEANSSTNTTDENPAGLCS